ncbi:MAG TPA: dUTP diphosphatase [Acholeplasma sp.]|jgi:dUTP pyrophosphatase|nr:dUTP diphosphatase [Acholeplasma sp.]
MRRFELVSSVEKDYPLPKRATSSSAGYDLSSLYDYEIKPGEITLIATGVKAKMPANEALFVFPRSSLAIKTGLMMSNGVGVVDSDYYNNEKNEGHIFIPLFHLKNESVFIKKGERIAQGIFMKYEKVSDEMDLGIKRLGGFGSSDV